MKKTPRTAMTRIFISVTILAPAWLLISGCAVNSWFDPSVVGRWDKTPAVAPIIDRLDVVEPAEKEFVKTREVTPGDLIPVIQAYSISSSDALLVEVFELFEPGTPYSFQRVVDNTGDISVPLIGTVHAEGYSEGELQRVIADRLQPDILRDPQVSVVVQNKTQNRFSISGPAGAGLINISNPRYHLTDALAAYGSTPDDAEYIYVIRQSPLDDVILTETSHVRQQSVAQGVNGNGNGTLAPVDEQDKTPGVDNNDQSNTENDGTGESANTIADIDLNTLIDELAMVDAEQSAGEPAVANQPTELTNNQDNGVSSESGQESNGPALQMPKPGEGKRPSKWVYLNGKWVRVELKEGAVKKVAEPGDLVTDLDMSDLVTQQVIRIPVKPLLQGVAACNIIIRPNDIIRIPAPESGIIYLQGEIARPGSFALPTPGRSTLIRAVAGAGGLAPLAIPERVDIIRLLPNNRQATVRINFRAVMNMEEPDIYLKPGDVINVGTSWFAAPLAVIRNGFRTSYGFGFLLDRNFGTDVFGAPPTNIGLR